MLPPIPPGWRSLLKEETRKPYYRALDVFLEKELAGGQTVLPTRKDIFNALASTSYDQVRVLLVGRIPIQPLVMPMASVSLCSRPFGICLSPCETSIGNFMTMWMPDPQ